MLKNKIGRIFKNKIVITICAAIFPIILELLINKKIEFNTFGIVRLGFMYLVYLLIGIYFLLKKYSKLLNKIASFMIKKRYIIALVILIVGVLFKINFSSINMWSEYVAEPEQNNVIIGKARGIRSDEWLTQSPLLLGEIKGEDAYQTYNKNIAQGNINMNMSNLPVLDILTLGKPLTWGYIFFDEEIGFSFYWMLKIVLLFLVSIEFVMKITKKDNLLTLVGGFILATAPAIMWWLSSAIADGYVFGMLTIILFSYYMNNLDYKIYKKIGIAIGLLISIPAFAFVLYPAFQVPFAFFMLIVMLNDFINNFKQIKKIDVILIVLTIIGIAALLARFIIICWNDINIMMSTVYPGNRISTGGDFTLDRFISYFANIFYPYSESLANPCEPSGYIFSFIGLITLLIYSVNNIKKDRKDEKTGKLKFSTITKLTISLSLLFVLFILWEFIGFGETFAKITFLSMVPSQRLHVIAGMIATILSIIMIKTNENKKIFSKLQAILISVFTVAISYILIKNTSVSEFFNTAKIEIWSVVIFAITYCMLTCNKKAWAYVITIVAIIAGITVNPISIGISPINNTIISKEIQKINEQDKDVLWAGNSNITGQYLVANGIKTLNGVHQYPNFEWLNIVDPDGKYNEIYNRFAHIHIGLGNETNFMLLAQDSYLATLTYNDLQQLGVKYYYTSEKCSEDIIKQFKLEYKYCDEERSQYIYIIK